MRAVRAHDRAAHAGHETGAAWRFCFLATGTKATDGYQHHGDSRGVAEPQCSLGRAAAGAGNPAGRRGGMANAPRQVRAFLLSVAATALSGREMGKTAGRLREGAAA